jgi:hypothetical protein
MTMPPPSASVRTPRGSVARPDTLNVAMQAARGRPVGAESRITALDDGRESGRP